MVQRTSQQRLRGAVIGLRRGVTFVRTMSAQRDAVIVALADPDAPQREVARRSLPLAAGENVVEADTLADLLEMDVPLDFVVLARPPIGRVDDVELALSRGIHVLSEIPAVWTREECDRLVAAVEASSAQYMMAENCLYWGFIDSARRMREAGMFGAVYYAEAEMFQDMRGLLGDPNDPLNWRRKRTNPIVYCTHSVGPLLRITNTYPVEVLCMGTADTFETGMGEVQTALIRLNDGGMIRLTVSLLNEHWFGHRFVLHGSKASFDTGWLMLDQPKFWTADIPHLQGPIPLPLGADIPSAPPRAKQTGEAQMNWLLARAFLDCIRTGERPLVDVYDAIMFSLPGLCAAESAMSGGKAISIPQYQQRRRATS